MNGDTDFNFSDNDDDATGGEVDDTSTTHAGDGDTDDDADAGGGGDEDRGDVVTPGQGEEGDPDAAATAAAAAASVDMSADQAADPEFLRQLAEQEGGDKPPATVPYARVAELSAHNKQLENALAIAAEALKVAGGGKTPAAATEAAPAFNLRDQVKARNAALLEGDEDKAADIDLAIEEWRNNTLRAQARQEAMQDFAASQEQTAVEAVVADAFTKYTFLSSDSSDYNKEALDDVMMYRDRYLKDGEKLSVAVAKAVAKVAPMYAKAEDLPAAGDLPAGEVGKDGKVSAAAAAAIVRNAKVAAAQPPSTAQAGTPNKESIDVGKLDFENMSDDDYEKLPEAVKARARGDVAA